MGQIMALCVNCASDAEFAEVIRSWVGRMRSAKTLDDKMRLERDMLNVAADRDRRVEPKPEIAPEHRHGNAGYVHGRNGRRVMVTVKQRRRDLDTTHFLFGT